MKEFHSEEEMLQYEKDRENYYLSRIREIDESWTNFYKQLFLDIFSKKHRRLHREYSNYIGGFWRDSEGRICVQHIELLIGHHFNENDIAIERNKDIITGIFVYRQDCWTQVAINNLEEITWI